MNYADVLLYTLNKICSRISSGMPIVQTVIDKFSEFHNDIPQNTFCKGFYLFETFETFSYKFNISMKSGWSFYKTRYY